MYNTSISTHPLQTLHFLKVPENSLEMLKVLENKFESLKVLENNLKSLKVLENNLESLKLQENRLVIEDWVKQLTRQKGYTEKMVEEANGMCVRLVLIASGSFEEVCSRLEDLLDTLPTLLSDNEGLSKDDLVFSNMGQNEKELNSRFCVLVCYRIMLANVKSYTPVVFAAEQLKDVWFIADFPSKGTDQMGHWTQKARVRRATRKEKYGSHGLNKSSNIKSAEGIKDCPSKSHMVLGVALVAIIDRQLPFEYTITSRSTDVVVPLPAAPAADSEAQVLSQWNAIYDAYNEVACLILGSMTIELHRQFENSSPYDMIKELKAMFEKQAGVERFDLIQTFHACKQEEGKPVAAYVIQMKGYKARLTPSDTWEATLAIPSTLIGGWDVEKDQRLRLESRAKRNEVGSVSWT
ncbi:hypothetical protein Tco_0078929 [Tanacetum coccineum]